MTTRRKLFAFLVGLWTFPFKVFGAKKALPEVWTPPFPDVEQKYAKYAFRYTFGKNKVMYKGWAISWTSLKDHGVSELSGQWLAISPNSATKFAMYASVPRGPRGPVTITRASDPAFVDREIQAGLNHLRFMIDETGSPEIAQVNWDKKHPLGWPTLQAGAGVLTGNQ